MAEMRQLHVYDCALRGGWATCGWSLAAVLVAVGWPLRPAMSVLPYALPIRHLPAEL